MRWSLIVEPEGRPGHEQMATDDALLRSAREGVAYLRLYAWRPPCLSFGRNEPAAQRYDRRRIAALGLDTVRRPTGGRAVWHDAEVTYAVAGPAALFGSLQATYLAIHTMLATALCRLGVPATLARPRAPILPSAGACFAAPVGGEIVVRDGKLVGSAQVREGGAFLQHGAILLQDAQDVVSSITLGPVPSSAASSLGAALGRDVTFAEIATAITEAARHAWPGIWAEAQPPRLEGSGRYADPAWTWRS